MASFMSWNTTLVIAHAPSNTPIELRSALATEGRRCLTWDFAREAPNGLKDADVVVVMPSIVAGQNDERTPFPRAQVGKALILALSAGAARWADAVLHPQVSIKPIADRVGALIRLTTLEWECQQRRKTFAALGGGKAEERVSKPPETMRVLHIGGPNPEFAHLQATLLKNDIELRPSLRPSLALDDIENGLVDAVLLDASVSSQTVRELSIILRRNTDLALSPVLVLDPKTPQVTYSRAPSLTSDIIRAHGEPDLVVARLKQLVTETRRRRMALEFLKRSRTRERHDPRTGLASFALIDAHLRTHVESLKQSGRALSAGLMKVTPVHATLNAADMQALSEQVGSLIARLIRAEDMATMTSQTSVAFLFPATLETSAQSALKRIAAVLRATRFHSPRIVDGVEVDVDWTALQPREDQSGAELWDVGDHDQAAGNGNGV